MIKRFNPIKKKGPTMRESEDGGYVLFGDYLIGMGRLKKLAEKWRMESLKMDPQDVESYEEGAANKLFSCSTELLTELNKE